MTKLLNCNLNKTLLFFSYINYLSLLFPLSALSVFHFDVQPSEEGRLIDSYQEDHKSKSSCQHNSHLWSLIKELRETNIKSFNLYILAKIFT